MKTKLFLLIVCVVMSAGYARGQWGVKAGSSFARFTADNAKTGAGAFAGVFYDWNISGNLYVRPGLAYHFDRATAQVAEDVLDTSYRMHYLKLPVHLSYHIRLNGQNSLNPYIGAYMYGGLFGQSKDHYSWASIKSTNIYDGLKRFNYGLTGGVEYEFKKRFLLSAEYNIGLNNVMRKFDGEFASGPDYLKRLNSVCVGIGYKF